MGGAALYCCNTELAKHYFTLYVHRCRASATRGLSDFVAVIEVTRCFFLQIDGRLNRAETTYTCTHREITDCYLDTFIRTLFVSEPDEKSLSHAYSLAVQCSLIEILSVLIYFFSLILAVLLNLNKILLNQSYSENGILLSNKHTYSNLSSSTYCTWWTWNTGWAWPACNYTQTQAEI